MKWATCVDLGRVYMIYDDTVIVKYHDNCLQIFTNLDIIYVFEGQNIYTNQVVGKWL